MYPTAPIRNLLIMGSLLVLLNGCQHFASEPPVKVDQTVTEHRPQGCEGDSCPLVNVDTLTFADEPELNRLIDVVKVVDLTEHPYIERELMLIKLRAVGKEREELKRMADIFRGRIIDVTDKDYTIELTGTGAKLDAFLKAIDATAILETVRTGASGIGRGDRILKV